MKEIPFADVVLKEPTPKMLGLTTALWQAFMRKFMTMSAAPEAWVQPDENGTLDIFYILPPDARTTEGMNVAGKKLLLLQVPQGGWEYRQ